jgi:hypothetical protein
VTAPHEVGSEPAEPASEPQQPGESSGEPGEPGDPGEAGYQPPWTPPIEVRREWWREPLAALLVAAAVSAVGAPVGLLWAAVTPRVEIIMSASGPTLADSEPEQYVAGDGWFVFLTVAAGVLLAVLVWLLVRRYRGPVMLVALAVGSVASAVIAAWVGHRIGLSQYQSLLKHATVGQHFRRPVNVATKDVGLWFGFLPRTQGAVLFQAAASVTLYTLLAGFHRAASLRDEDVHIHEPEPLQPVSSGWTGQPDPPAVPEPPAPGPAAQPRD